MKKLLVRACCLLIGFSTPLMADGIGVMENLDGEVGYLSISDSEISLGALYGIMGYKFEHSNRYASTFGLMTGFGIGGDSESIFGVDVDVRLGSIFGLSYKGTFKLNNDTALYYNAMYAGLTVKADFLGFPIDTKKSDFALGFGLVYKAISISYISYTGDIESNGISVAYKY